MALDDSALLEMIGILRTADGGVLMRRLLGGMLQAVVDAEATAHRRGRAPAHRGSHDSAQQHPRPVAEMLLDAKTDLIAFADFPLPHWRKIWSTNPLERINREVKRRTDVVGIFPNPAALLRLSSCVLIEAHNEWQDSDCRYLSKESMALLNPPAPTVLATKTTSSTTTPKKEIAATA